MAKVRYFVLAENFIMDDSRRVSIINMFDNLNSSDAIAVPAKFLFAFTVDLDKSDNKDKVEIEIEILNPDKKTVVKLEGGGPIPQSEIGKSIVSQIDLSGKVSFDTEGKHTAVLRVNGKQRSELSFLVNLNKKELE